MKIRNQSQPKITRRMTAFLLFFSMLLPIFTFFPSYAVDEAVEPIDENTAAELAPIETEDQVFARLTADSQVLNYVDETAFRAAGHVNRLPAEEDLNSYVFENEDGTRTAYILAEPVKYINSTGTVQEKDLSLSSSSIVANAALARAVDTSAYTVTATDTPMTFPADLSQGVRFTYKNYTVTLRPEIIRENTLFLQADGKVMYHNAFGTTAHLMYTPTNTGLKEDILLVREGDINTFSFILNTDGLIPAEDAGGWYLWDGIDISRQIRLGQVISYDANGDFSIGEMAVTHNGGTTYRITLTVDPTFLANAIYPVTVDPSVEVHDEGSNGGSIEDIVLFEGAPNACYRSMQYNTVGYADASLLEGRTAIRVSGLYNHDIYGDMDYQQITSVFLNVWDHSSVAQTVNLYPLTTTAWSEANATWNNLANCYDATKEPIDSVMIPVKSAATFDITSLVVDGWKENRINPAAGFILVGNDTVVKKIGSCENTTVSKRPYVVMNYDNRVIINCNDHPYIKIGESRTLTAFIRPETWVDIDWVVEDPTVFTLNIDETNPTVVTVTGNSYGTTQITATVTFADGTIGIGAITMGVVYDGIYTFYNDTPSSGDTSYNFYLRLVEGTVVVSSQINNELHNELYRYWRIVHHKNGEYSIRSMANEQQMLGIDTGTVSLKFKEEIDDSVMWYIRKNGYFWQLIPKSDPGKYLSTIGNEKETNGNKSFDLAIKSSDEIPHEEHRSWALNKKTFSGAVLRSISSPRSFVLKNTMEQTLSAAPLFFSIEHLGYEIYMVSSSNNEPISITWSALDPDTHSDSDILWIQPNSGYMRTIGIGDVVIIATIEYQIDDDTTQEIQLTINLTIKDIISSNYYIRNVGNNRFLQIQNGFLKNTNLEDMENSMWSISHYQYGYYTIRIGSSYLCVLDGNVSLSSESDISNNKLFLIEPLPSGDYLIKPKAQNTAVTASDIDDSLLLINNDEAPNGQWTLIENNTSQTTLHPIKVKILYDKGYFNLHNNSLEIMINENILSAQNFYLKLGVYFDFIFDLESSMFESTADQACKMKCDNECDCTYTCNDSYFCDHIGQHDCNHSCKHILDTNNQCHANIYTIHTGIKNIALNNCDFVVAFIGHDLCIQKNNEHGDCNGGHMEIDDWCFIEGNSSIITESTSFIHELGHVLNAPDHYGKKENLTVPSTDDLNTKKDGNVYYLGDGKYSNHCLYGYYLSAYRNDLCEGCMYQIKTYISKLINKTAKIGSEAIQ